MTISTSAPNTAEQVLGSVESVCSTCLQPIQATIVDRHGAVWLVKECEVHGREEVLESSTRDFYHVAPERSCCSGSGCCDGSSNEPVGPSCVALFEITDRCNLECPVCFAGSSPAHSYVMSRSEFEDRLEKVVAKRGTLDIVMLSGGEPTTHPEFAELLGILDRSPHVRRVLLNTNGVLIARSASVRAALGAYRSKLEIYLQFDGTEAATVVRLRGDESLLKTKQEALERLAELSLPTTLAVTVAPELQSAELGSLLDLSLSLPHVRGLTFQPVFTSGRFNLDHDPATRVTTPEIIRRICEARPDVFQQSAFTNLPCSHPNCAIVAYFYRASQRLWPLCSEIEPDESLRDRINFTLEDLMRCGCETTELGQYIQRAELSPENSFRVVIKPFMDRHTLNRARTQLCCTHVVGPEGQIMSFCEYNIFRESLRWNQNHDQPAAGRSRLRVAAG